MRVPSSHYVVHNNRFVPIYKLPVTRYSRKKIRPSWGLGWFYFRQLWAKVRAGNLGKYVWFKHLYLELITLLCLPYTLPHNLIYEKESNIDFRDTCPED